MSIKVRQWKLLLFETIADYRWIVYEEEERLVHDVPDVDDDRAGTRDLAPDVERATCPIVSSVVRPQGRSSEADPNTQSFEKSITSN